MQNLKKGLSFEEAADVVISARGTLNDMSWPDIEGFSDLKIPVMHSAKWNDRSVGSAIIDTMGRKILTRVGQPQFREPTRWDHRCRK